MKVYIQHRKTRLYLNDEKDWVKNETEARCFKSSIPAIDFCLANKIEHAIILMRFGDKRYDIRLRPFLRNSKED